MLSSLWTASFACPSGSHRGPSRLSSVSSAVSPVWPSGSQSLRSQFTSGPTSHLSCSPVVVSLTLPRGSLGGPGRPDLARGYTVTCVLPEPTLFTAITLDGCTDFSPPGTAVACLSCQVLSGNLALVTQTGRGLGVGWGVLSVLGSHGGVVGAMPAELELPCLLNEGLGGGEDTAVTDVACAAAAGLWLGEAPDTTWRLPLLSVGTELASGMEGGPGGPLSALSSSQGPQEGRGAPPGSAGSSRPGTDLAFAFLVSQVPGTGWPSSR